MVGDNCSPTNSPPTPTGFALQQNYPNPFNPETAIVYSLSRPTRITLTVYNLNGQPVRTLVRGQQRPGAHRALWDGRDNHGVRVASGIYFYRLQAAGHRLTRRMLLLR